MTARITFTRRPTGISRSRTRTFPRSPRRPTGCRLLRPEALRSDAIFPAGAVLLQLVVQRLQADAEDLGRARLVVASVLERSQDQLLLRLFHRSADLEAHAFTILGRRRRRGSGRGRGSGSGRGGC